MPAPDAQEVQTHANCQGSQQVDEDRRAGLDHDDFLRSNPDFHERLDLEPALCRLLRAMGDRVQTATTGRRQKAREQQQRAAHVTRPRSS